MIVRFLKLILILICLPGAFINLVCALAMYVITGKNFAESALSMVISIEEEKPIDEVLRDF